MAALAPKGQSEPESSSVRFLRMQEVRISIQSFKKAVLRWGNSMVPGALFGARQKDSMPEFVCAFMYGKLISFAGFIIF